MTKLNFKHYTDEQLVSQYQDGREEALSYLIKRFHPKLLRIVHYQTRGGGPVEDIVQECWYSIINNLPGLNLKISFGAWAASIARNKAVDWIRLQQRQRERQENLERDIDSRTGVTDSIDEEHTLKILHFSINQLPHTQRIILNMFYIENLSLQEISCVLEISKGTVKSRLFHAREKLKEIVNQQTEE